jgi:hypothetical protein
MKTAMEQALARIELLYGMKPDAIHWEMFKNDCMGKEKEQIMNDYREGVNAGILYCNGEVFISKEEYYNQNYNQKIPELLYKDGTPMRKVKLGKEAQELLDEQLKDLTNH